MKILTFLLTTFLSLFLFWGLGWLWFATNIAVMEQAPVSIKSDAIIVVTGGYNRINTGLDLLDDKQATKLFISGVHENSSITAILNSWKRPLNERNNKGKPCCITLGYKAKDTNGNAIEVQEWVNSNDITSIRFVTSSYHMPRAHLMIARLLPEITIIKHPVFTDDFQPWEGRFWPLTFSEYNKWLITLIMPNSLYQTNI